VILGTKPHRAQGDDGLHLLCQTEIHLLILIVYVVTSYGLTSSDSFPPSVDAALSALFIFLTILVICVFVIITVRKMFEFYQRVKEHQQENFEQRVEKENADEEDLHEGGDVEMMEAPIEGDPNNFREA